MEGKVEWRRGGEIEWVRIAKEVGGGGGREVRRRVRRFTQGGGRTKEITCKRRNEREREGKKNTKDKC